MKFGSLSSFAILAILSLSAARPVPAAAQSYKNLFNLSMNAGVIAGWHREPWPSVYFKGVRLWDTDTTWRNMNPRDGVYNWSELDRWLAVSGKGGNDLVYTFGSVPGWVSSVTSSAPTRSR